MENTKNDAVILHAGGKKTPGAWEWEVGRSIMNCLLKQDCKLGTSFWQFIPFESFYSGENYLIRPIVVCILWKNLWPYFIHLLNSNFDYSELSQKK